MCRIQLALNSGSVFSVLLLPLWSAVFSDLRDWGTFVGLLGALMNPLLGLRWDAVHNSCTVLYCCLLPQGSVRAPCSTQPSLPNVSTTCSTCNPRGSHMISCCTLCCVMLLAALSCVLLCAAAGQCAHPAVRRLLCPL